MSNYTKLFISNTLDETLDKGINKNADVVGKIFALMKSDGKNESQLILQLFKESKDEERALLNRLLVSLCGHGIETIINKTV